MNSTMQAIEAKDAFFWQVLEEMDGFDGVLLAKEMYQFIVERDGSCPYTIAEIDLWMDKDDCPE